MNRAFWDAIFLITGSLFTYGTGQDNSTLATNSTVTTIAPMTTATVNVTTSATTSTNITTIPVKKFVAAAVHRSHFGDCPDSHSHFCFHGTCRFLILEDTPACVCHQGFVGMRCEHADLLAVVATNHRKQTVATVLVLCVIGCVLTMLLCTLLHCLWSREGFGRSHRPACATEEESCIMKCQGNYCHSVTVV